MSCFGWREYCPDSLRKYLELYANFIFHFDGPASNADRRNPKFRLSKLNRAGVMSIITLHLNPDGTSLAMHRKVTANRPLPFTSLSNGSGAKLYLVELLAIQDLWPEHRALN